MSGLSSIRAKARTANDRFSENFKIKKVQRRFKNYTVLMDKVLNRDYHNFLDPRLIKFLDSIEGDI